MLISEVFLFEITISYETYCEDYQVYSGHALICLAQSVNKAVSLKIEQSQLIRPFSYNLLTFRSVQATRHHMIPSCLMTKFFYEIIGHWCI